MCSPFVVCSVDVCSPAVRPIVARSRVTVSPVARSRVTVSPVVGLGRLSLGQTRRSAPYGFWPHGVCTNVLDNCMEMVGHDDIFITFYVRKFVFQFTIPFAHHPPCVVKHHFPVHDIAEKTFPLFRANGHKIRPGLGIIVSGQTNRSAVWSGSVLPQTWNLFPVLRRSSLRHFVFHFHVQDMSIWKKHVQEHGLYGHIMQICNHHTHIPAGVERIDPLFHLFRCCQPAQAGNVLIRRIGESLLKPRNVFFNIKWLLVKVRSSIQERLSV